MYHSIVPSLISVCLATPTVSQYAVFTVQAHLYGQIGAVSEQERIARHILELN